MKDDSRHPFVSVIIPARNEEAYILECLTTIIQNGYPIRRLEILVVDGESEDRTKEIVQKLSEIYPQIKIVENKKKITPVAFNLGIKASKGDVIMLMGAHATYPKEYISKCVKYLYKWKADNVGGTLEVLPGDKSIMTKATAFAMFTPFWGGGSYRKGSANSRPQWVDTVFGGCYRRDVFKKIGLFDERFVRGQDIDLNLRLKRAGGKILFVPEIIAYYYAAFNFASFVKKNFADGLWVTYSTKFTKMPLTPRHYVPVSFTVAFIGSTVIAFLYNPLLLVLLLLTYFSGGGYFAFLTSMQEKNPSYFFVMPFLFLFRHLLYGAGSLWGFVKILV